jgi:hypothetical protein
MSYSIWLLAQLAFTLRELVKRDCSAGLQREKSDKRDGGN